MSAGPQTVRASGHKVKKYTSQYNCKLEWFNHVHPIFDKVDEYYKSKIAEETKRLEEEEENEEEEEEEERNFTSISRSGLPVYKQKSKSLNRT